MKYFVDFEKAEKEKEQAAAKKDPDEEEDYEDGEDGEDVGPSPISKYGIGGINRPIQKKGAFLGYCPIHFAVKYNHIVSILLKLVCRRSSMP